MHWRPVDSAGPRAQYYQLIDAQVQAHINAGDRYIPWTEDSGDITACGIPINYNASKEWADKKVVLFSVPGM